MYINDYCHHCGGYHDGPFCPTKDKFYGYEESIDEWPYKNRLKTVVSMLLERVSNLEKRVEELENEE